MNWFTDGDEGSFESSLFFLDQQQQQQQQTMKEEQIRQCLSAPENIDLWELRKLAISKGGLLSEKWRQQAWNKFVASHESIWKNAQQRTTQQQVVAYHHPTQQDIREIRQLVQKAVWSLQPIRSRCKIQNKKEVLLQPTTANLSSSPQEQQHSKEELQAKNDGNNNGLKMDKEERNKETQPFHHNNHHIEKLNTNSGLRRRVSFDMPESTDGGNTPIHDSTTKEERQTLRKILIHLKRTNPTFSQFPGIQNLVAILCIVFQSPSVTSLVVQKMISHHWNTNHNGGDDRDLYMRILQRFDPELYLLWSSQYWIYSTPHSIRSSWIPCWFSQDIFKLNILLRIWDVFLVSHPHFPMYVPIP